MAVFLSFARAQKREDERKALLRKEGRQVKEERGGEGRKETKARVIKEGEERGGGLLGSFLVV